MFPPGNEAEKKQPGFLRGHGLPVNITPEVLGQSGDL